MSSNILTESDEYAIELIKQSFINNYGSDFALNDDGDDIQVIGGDIRVNGTYNGNTVKHVQNLIIDRIKTRTLTGKGESPLLSSGYGSNLSNLVGYSKMINQSVISNLTQVLVHDSLMDEPMIDTDSISTKVAINNETINVNIKASSGLINVSVNQVLKGD
jgi:hypothetical protein